jgi:outer membrane immunogenic protein
MMMVSRAFTRLLLGAACAAALATSANAADAVVEEAVIVTPGISWTGLYVGVNAGYSWGDFDHSLDVAPADLGIAVFPGFSETFRADADGISGGAQAGFNWQVNNFVFGFEADIQAASLDGDISESEIISITDPIAIDIPVELDASTEVEWFGTARLRAGFLPTERLLVYGTGGFAFGRTKSTASISAELPIIGTIGDETSSSDTRTGWAAGGGAEFAIDDNWSIKGEYLYTDLGKEDIFTFAEDPFAATLSSEVKFHTVRIGLNYGF